MEIKHIPDTVDHAKLVEFLGILGFTQIESLESLFFGPNGVKVTIWPKNETGSAHVGYDGENIAKYIVEIPYDNVKQPKWRYKLSDEVLRY